MPGSAGSAGRRLRLHRTMAYTTASDYRDRNQGAEQSRAYSHYVHRVSPSPPGDVGAGGGSSDSRQP